MIPSPLMGEGRVGVRIVILNPPSPAPPHEWGGEFGRRLYRIFTGNKIWNA